MTIVRKTYLAACTFLQICCVAFLFTSCENDEKEVKELNVKSLGIEEGKHIISYMSSGGKTKGKLTAPYMIRNQFDSSKIEFPKTLQVDFYDSSLKIESHLFAKYGKYLENDNTIYLRDSVIVFNIKNDSLFTSELIWDQNKNIFYTAKPVVISNNNGNYRQKVAASGGFKSDQGFNNITLYKVGKSFDPSVNSFLILKDSTSFY